MQLNSNFMKRQSFGKIAAKKSVYRVKHTNVK
jgi:hypothetical protein